MEFKDRIQQRLHKLQLSATDVSKRIGVSKTTVSFWMSGTNGAKGKNLLALAKALECSPDWLETGRGNPDAAHEEGDHAPRTPSEADYALIPQLSAIGTGGTTGHLNDHVEVKGGLAFKREWLARMRVKPETCCVIYAQGSSMEPFIFEGDVALIDYSDPTPQDGKVYAIRRPDGGVSIKRMVQQLSGSWLIRSDNPDKARYADETMTADSLHEMPIIGRVVWRGGGM